MPCPNWGKCLRIAWTALALAVLAPAARPAAIADSPAGFPQVVSVTKTFDGKPFEYRIESRIGRPACRMYRLTYPSPVVTPVEQNNVIPAEYYLPSVLLTSDPPRPAVICIHILEGDFSLVRMTCSMLASHGIPAIMFKLPYYGERGFPEGPRAMAADPKLLAGALSQALEDIRRTVDLLASRPEVDPQRIGITGISLGGIVAAAAAGYEPRLSRAMPILAGGDLDEIIHHARETRQLSKSIRALPPQERREIENALRAVDPLQHAPALRDRAQEGKVLMVNATEDEVIPPPCTVKLASALGIQDKVIWLEGLGHYTAMAELPGVLRTAVEFFGQDMPPGLELRLPAPQSRRPREVVASLLRQVSSLASPAEEGRGHIVDFDLSIAPAGDQTIEGRLRLIRDWQGRFRLEGDLPMLGETTVGHGDYPWIVSGGKVVFRGIAADPAEKARRSADPLAFAESDYLLRLRMLAGVAAGVALAPQVLDEWVTIADETPAGGPQTIQITWSENDQVSLRLVLREDGKRPHQAAFNVPGAKGTLTFRVWQANTVVSAAMFEPPAGLATRDVDPTDLYRIFGAMFNFAVENAQ